MSVGPANCKCSGVESSWLRGPVALSPDGGQLAFVAVRETGGHVLCVRDLGNGDLQEIADGTRISSPFWSPDGRSIGYIGDAGLTVVEMNGGKPEILTASSIGGRGAGAAWADDGTIVYGGSYRTRLMKVDRMTGLAEPALGPFPDRTTDRTAGDIVVVDIRRGSELRLTRDERNESSPIWSLDDTEIYFFEGPTSTRSSRMEPVRQHSCTPARGQRVHATSAPTGGRCSLPSPIFRIPTNICGYWTWRAVRRSGGLTHQRRRTPGK